MTSTSNKSVSRDVKYGNNKEKIKRKMIT